MKNKKGRTKLIIVASLVILTGNLLIVSLAKNFLELEELVKMLGKESRYIIFGILVLVPLLLLLILIDPFKSKNIINTNLPTAVVPQVISEKVEVKEEKVDEKEKKEIKERFYQLSQIDKNSKKYLKETYEEKASLKEICTTFRNYAASVHRLYYDILDIRRFIASLSVTHLLILQGMSGTGKTSLAYAFGEFVENTSTVVPIQPMWKERTDLIGYYNEFTKRFNETVLLQKLYEANYSKDVYITVLDEMNIARVEYYFAEFLSLLELPDPDKRYLDVVSDKWNTDPVKLIKGQIKLPVNMWFIGTANNDDSTFAISDKVYDRAMVLNLDSKTKPFIAPRTKTMHLSAEYYNELVNKALKEYEITSRNQRRIKELDEYLIKHFHITFGNRIMKHINTYVPVFVACGGDEVEAIDDILSKKVLRKLEAQNPVYIKNSAEGFCTYLDELFGVDKMKHCKEYMRRLERNI